MSAFFRLVAVDVDEDALHLDLASHPEYSFTLGERFDPPPVGPVQFEIDGTLDGTRAPTLWFPEPVVSDGFLRALRQAGVTNIDDYPARIAGPGGASIAGYRAINIVGAVACADLQRSRYESFEGMTFFDELVLDAQRARGWDLFRLAEAHEIVVVSARLAGRLDLAAFPDVALLPVRS